MRIEEMYPLIAKIVFVGIVGLCCLLIFSTFGKWTVMATKENVKESVSENDKTINDLREKIKNADSIKEKREYERRLREVINNYNILSYYKSY